MRRNTWIFGYFESNRPESDDALIRVAFCIQHSCSFSYVGYPLVICYIAIENGPVEIVDFPMKNGGSFQFAMLVYQAGYYNGYTAINTNFTQVSKPHHREKWGQGSKYSSHRVSSPVLERPTRHSGNPEKVAWSEWGFGFSDTPLYQNCQRETSSTRCDTAIYSQLVHEPMGKQNNTK